MTPFYLQVEFAGRRTTLMVQQLDQPADINGFMCYQIRTFNQHSVVFVNTEQKRLCPIGFSDDEGFTAEEIKVIVVAIRDYNSNCRRSADQIVLDF